ncbi:MAG TPA: hypothetical protein DCM86_05035 [Verrucomicrobiales bacterium]|nr:hypothetical protein [Verrucomicrobiales bacterium]
MAWVCLAFGVASAQVPAEAIRRLNNTLANDAVTTVEVFSAANTIGTGSFKYDNPGPDDVRFETYKLPLSHTFGAPTNSLRPVVEGYLGYFDLKEGLNTLAPPEGALRIRSITTTAGGGFDWQVNRWLSASPRLLLAYSHAWQRLARLAPPGDPVAALLPDWEADAMTLIPSIQLAGGWSCGRWDLGVTARYTYLRSFGLHDNSPLIEIRSESHVWRNELSASYRSDWRLWGSSLRPFWGFARHDLGGRVRDAGFVRDFYEARMGLGFSTPGWLHPVRELALTGAYYFEGPLTGTSFGVSAEF